MVYVECLEHCIFFGLYMLYTQFSDVPQMLCSSCRTCKKTADINQLIDTLKHGLLENLENPPFTSMLSPANEAPICGGFPS